MTDSAVSQSEASHLHLMNEEPKSGRSSQATSTTTLEQCETGVPEHFFFSSKLTHSTFIATSDAKLIKKRCKDTFKDPQTAV